MNTMRREEFVTQRQKHFKDFVQTVAVCDELQQRKNAALRAQVHDLTELLAGYDLASLQNTHLEIVRDRAYRRDIAPDGDLLRVYQSERRSATMLGDVTSDGEAVQMDSVDNTESPPSVSGNERLEPDARQRARVERLVAEEEQAMIQKPCERATKTIREQQQKIAVLEDTVATQANRNESLERENRRFQAMVSKLHSTFDAC
ncbi:hypothetical protein BBJ29_002315 [Phytophthora kernoviae]|uniref:Uncharacterized protein n=1 Tax=Phytophthora kernoviae TaxID=325452 RepID=A0A3F2RQL1_9STRA|nr:hypothetical protein BBJ29_002315 [Phytophthora kernoviae]RLN62324.1 hypothetical protein BBP00_00004850 [Phytophthora kernoviae]